MGYLNNQVIEIDAILTKKGRQLLAQGSDHFQITQFALADDEVDYRLWNPDHGLGSNYYGEVIQNMPILEANPNETQMMKYKLVTLPKNTIYLPVITVASKNITLPYIGSSATITPTTINPTNGNATFGYTAILADSAIATLGVPPGQAVNLGSFPTVPDYSNYINGQSVYMMGFQFTITSKAFYGIHNRQTTITIIGNETGGNVIINLTVVPAYSQIGGQLSDL